MQSAEICSLAHPTSVKTWDAARFLTNLQTHSLENVATNRVKVKFIVRQGQKDKGIKTIHVKKDEKSHRPSKIFWIIKEFIINKLLLSMDGPASDSSNLLRHFVW